MAGTEVGRCGGSARRMLGIGVAGLVLTALAADRVSAQVGRAPQESPFRDVQAGRGPVVQAGFFTGGEGTAGVGLTNAVLAGVRHEWHLGGMFRFSGGAAMVRGERYIVDPTAAEATRRSGPVPDYAMTFDADMAVIVTGRKTWHGLAPFVVATVGMLFGGAEPDEETSSYRLGTKFILGGGGGVRWYPTPRMAFAADARVLQWRIRYPTQFYVPPAVGGPPVLDLAVERSEWVRHPLFRLAVGWTF